VMHAAVLGTWGSFLWASVTYEWTNECMQCVEKSSVLRGEGCACAASRTTQNHDVPLHPSIVKYTTNSTINHVCMQLALRCPASPAGSCPVCCMPCLLSACLCAGARPGGGLWCRRSSIPGTAGWQRQALQRHSGQARARPGCTREAPPQGRRQAARE
jgi:hypothetical protein